MEPVKTMKSETVATIRTTVNTTVMAAILAVVAKATGWDIQVDDLLPYMPIIIPVAAAFYRLSRYAAAKFPAIGVLLFGVSTPPLYVPPATPLDVDVIEPPAEFEAPDA